MGLLFRVAFLTLAWVCMYDKFTHGFAVKRDTHEQSVKIKQAEEKKGAPTKGHGVLSQQPSDGDRYKRFIYDSILGGQQHENPQDDLFDWYQEYKDNQNDDSSDDKVYYEYYEEEPSYEDLMNEYFFNQFNNRPVKSEGSKG